MSAHDTSTHSRTRPQRNAPVPKSKGPRRLLLLRAGLAFAFAALGVRLVFLQVVDHAHYAKLSIAQVNEQLTTTALRGGIYDRHGETLAVSRPTSLVIADDMQITNPVTEAKAMSPLVKVPVAKLTAMLSKKHDGYVIINHDLDLTDGRKVSSLQFQGIVVQNSSVRTYPDGTLATSVLGGVNGSGAGSAGLEYEYQRGLAGQTGITREFLSSSGVSLPASHSTVIKKAKPGVGLELTLDSSLQYIAERALAHELRSSGGLTGQAVVMDVKTGEILADASLVNTKSPAGVLGPISTWGKNVGVPGIQQTINNLPFSQAYEPGSVFKVVTFSAALQAGLITPTTVFPVPNSVMVGGRLFHDAETHGLEHLTATQVLAQSSNIGTYEIGRLVGEAGLLAQVQKLGFGTNTSIHYPGETPGLLVNAANWYASDQAALPIGQVDAVPAIQVLDAFNAIANGGVFVEPKLVRAYVYPDGVVKGTPKSATSVALSPTVDATLVKMLEQVVLDGTGTNAVIPGYSVAGKTGTSNIPYPGRDALLNGAFYATFVGFAPANNPVLSMIVVIERPTTSIYGGAVAAPVFQQVMSYALHHYGIPSNGVEQKPLKGVAASFSSNVT
ncbi:MAG TPA: penicillin-binding protein 2 [Acidimicrobiales bacterium]|nr:penicillin-binding protein 2 [Acidimicrobiales bacterium]